MRLPVPGRVKTRLAAGVGPQAACDFYAACAGYTLQLAARCRDTEHRTAQPCCMRAPLPLPLLLSLRCALCGTSAPVPPPARAGAARRRLPCTTARAMPRLTCRLGWSAWGCRCAAVLALLLHV